MVVLTHKVGMVLNVSEPLEDGRRKLIEQGIAGTTGVISADFSVSQGNMVVIEYDPYVTSPTELHQNIREINRTAVLRTVFVSRPPADEGVDTT
jgi:orotate phosphoribosyltransferase-like protein